MSVYQPKTGEPCHCKRGQQRDNCPDCEGTGMRIDFKAIREKNTKAEAALAQAGSSTPGPWDWKDGIQLAVGPAQDPEGNSVAVITGHPSEAFANARLIASAPALLAALKAIALEANYAEGCSSTTLGEIAINCERIARAAIAQAERGAL